MALRGYVTIDGKDYRVLTPGYERGIEPPKTVRAGVLGNTIVSLGPGSADMPVQALLRVPYEPTGSWGSLADLQAAAEKASVSYTDHITGDAGKWGSGTFDVTILRARVMHLQEAPRPEAGYYVSVEWTKVLG